MRLPLEAMGICYRTSGKGREYLMLHRSPENGGFWQSLTGGLEDGESFDAALLRELKEEIDLAPLRVTRLLEIRQFKHRFNGVPWAITECMFGVELSPESVVTLSKEHTEHSWCTLTEALALLTWDGNKNSLRLLDDYLDGKELTIPRIVTEITGISVRPR